MQADERTRTVVHREWTLRSPAHFTEITKTIAVANTLCADEPGITSDVTVSTEDDLIVVGYSVEVDELELKRRYDTVRRGLKRARMLAAAWSSRDFNDWREAADALNDVLDGDEPRVEPGDAVPADLTGGDDA